jgi:hypothetical protein
MSISMSIRDTRMFGPNLEVRRTIVAALGGKSIHLRDDVINRGDGPCAHGLLYHLNFGYPFLDEGARLIMGGRILQRIGLAEKLANSSQLERFKKIPAPSAEYGGSAESILVLEPFATGQGLCRVGLLNEALGIGLEASYPRSQLPRLGAMLHCGPRGSYMAALEPFSGSLIGKAADSHPESERQLHPGEAQCYELRITVHTSPEALESLRQQDRPLTMESGS